MRERQTDSEMDEWIDRAHRQIDKYRDRQSDRQTDI
jgi:hypothetical protein